MSRRGQAAQFWDPESFKAARKRLGLDQAELAERLGVTSTAVGRWEGREYRRYNVPQHPRLVRLAVLAVEAGLDAQLDEQEVVSA